VVLIRKKESVATESKFEETGGKNEEMRRVARCHGQNEENVMCYVMEQETQGLR